MEKNIPIRLVDYGLANNFGDCIEVNKYLVKNEELYNYVINHELGHTNKFFSIYDLKHEFKFNMKMVLKLMIFSIRHPKSLIDILPVYRRKSKIIFDLNMFVSYFLLAILVIALTILVSKIF